MIVIDTSVLLRFFTKDDKIKGNKAKVILESEKEILLIDAVFLELIFTLKRFYKLPKSEIVLVIRYLLSKDNIIVNNDIKKASEIFEKENMSFTDCLICVYGRGNKIASFDEKLIKASKTKY